MASQTENQTERTDAEFDTELGGAIAPTRTAAEPEPAASDQPWREWLDPVVEFIAQLPDSITRFVADYKQPLIALVLFVAAIIAVRITLAILEAINGIPLLAPAFELIGLGYSGWFVYRYLLRASTRQELGSEFQAIKAQIVGERP